MLPALTPQELSMAKIDEMKIDKRIVERNITKGLITKEQYAQHLDDLKDLTPKMDLVPIEEEVESDPLTQVDGKTYDAGIIAAAEEAIAGRGDGRISQADAEMLLAKVKDGDTYTDFEKATIKMLREKFQWTEAADEWFRTEIRSWAATKGGE